MIKVKDTVSKVTAAKRTITVSGVSIKDDILVDENGNISSEIIESLPEGITVFDVKITIEIPEDEI